MARFTNPSDRKVLADELAHMDPDYDPDAEAIEAPDPPVTAAPPEPARLRVADLVRLGLSVAEVRGLIADGLGYGEIAEIAQAQAEARRLEREADRQVHQEGTAAAIEQTKPRVHSREDYEYAHVSVFNPRGDLHHPRPGLRIPMFFGALDEQDPQKPPIRVYEITPEQCTYDEQVLLNQLQPYSGSMELNDGTKVPIEIHTPTDRVSGQATMLVIGMPKQMYEKSHRLQVPSLKRLARMVIEATAVPVA